MSFVVQLLLSAVGVPGWIPLVALSALACHPGKPGRELRVCSDPNNLPFSNQRGEGFENRLAELIAEATLAMRLEATVEDVIATIHAHPTLAETFREAALSAAGRPVHSVR